MILPSLAISILEVEEVEEMEALSYLKDTGRLLQFDEGVSNLA